MIRAIQTAYYQQAKGCFSYPSLRLVINDAVFPIAIDYLDHRTMLDEIKAIESVVVQT